MSVASMRGGPWTCSPHKPFTGGFMKKKMKKMLAGLGIAGLLGAGSIAVPGAMAASGSG